MFQNIIRTLVPPLPYVTWKYWKKIRIKKFFEIKKQKEIYANINLKILGIPVEYKLKLDPNDFGLSLDLYLFGFREPFHMFYLYKIIKNKKEKWLDIGANIGYFTIFLSKLKQKVFSIEPQRELIKILKENILLNNVRDRVSKIFNIAIGPTYKKVYIIILPSKNLSYISENPPSNSKQKIVKYYKVDMVPLSFFKEYDDITGLRIDVEGSEYDILLHNVPESINKIDLELHFKYLGSRKTHVLLRYLEDEGFIIKYYIADITHKYYFFIKKKYIKPIVKIFKMYKVLKNMHPTELIHEKSLYSKYGRYLLLIR